jgi:hypothetical protein
VSVKLVKQLTKNKGDREISGEGGENVKKDYSAPELTVHGTVEEITLGTCPPSPDSSKLIPGPDQPCNAMSPPDAIS